jgi:hypothetical protein
MMWISPFDYHYLILDCSLPEMRHHWYLHSKYANSEELLYADTRFSSILEISPLIAPTDLNDPFLHWLYANREIKSHNWGCLLHSSAKTADIAAHFRSWITVRDDVGQEVFFRFYDPDILPCFAAALQGEERQQFFGPVNAFVYREKGKDLLSASEANHPGEDVPAAASPLGPSPCFSFQERHMAAMRPVFRPHLVQEVMTALLPKVYSYMRHLPPESMLSKVDECLQKLAELQKVALPEKEDGIAFCLIAITSCSHFFESQEFQSSLMHNGMHQTLDEWKHYANSPIPGLELWHDPNWLPEADTEEKKI